MEYTAPTYQTSDGAVTITKVQWPSSQEARLDPKGSLPNGVLER